MAEGIGILKEGVSVGKDEEGEGYVNNIVEPVIVYSGENKSFSGEELEIIELPGTDVERIMKEGGEALVFNELRRMLEDVVLERFTMRFLESIEVITKRREDVTASIRKKLLENVAQ